MSNLSVEIQPHFVCMYMHMCVSLRVALLTQLFYVNACSMFAIRSCTRALYMNIVHVSGVLVHSSHDNASPGAWYITHVVDSRDTRYITPVFLVHMYMYNLCCIGLLMSY